MILDYRDFTVSICTACLLLFFFSKKIRLSTSWRATVTPLASIIGSGFLVSAPVIVLTTGLWSPLAITGIVVIAYWLGGVLRYNIEHLEPVLNHNHQYAWVTILEGVAKPFLGVAYIISMTFYLKLLSAFFFRGFNIHNIIFEESLTTVILLYIGLHGFFRGLTILERLELYSVNIKLSIIFALILGAMIFNVHLWIEGQWHINVHHDFSLLPSLQKMLGILIIIQGFETSRYLGELYSTNVRLTTMKTAQVISGFIYVTFVSMSMVMFNHVDHISEVATIDLSYMIASILPYLLIVAAIMSQFSAAVADSLGSAGLISESTRGRISLRGAVLGISILAVSLTWLTDIYEIITIASKAFAVYYALQCVIASVLVVQESGQTHFYRLWRFLSYSALYALMLAVIIFGIPAE